MTAGRYLVRFGTAIVVLHSWSGTASAHQGVAESGTPVPFPVVLWVPVLTGLLGGFIAVRYRNGGTDTHTHRMDGVLGVLLIALACSFAITSLRSSPLIGIAGASVGALVTRSIGSHVELSPRSHGTHIDLTLSGVCVHRLFEGIALGTLYFVNASVGVIGVAVIAGHTALETAAVGGLYGPRGSQAIVAIVLVQLGYVIGSVAGVVGNVSAPPGIHFVVIGVLAGALLIVGLAEIRGTVNPDWYALSPD